MPVKTFLFISVICVSIGAGALLTACHKEEAPRSVTPLEFTTPPGFPEPYYNFENNPLTREGVNLGRKLFYDGRLSKDGNFSCAACHQQFAAFATFDHDLSHGFDNQFTTRNAPGLFNLVWLKELHQDGGIANLEVQPLAPLTAPNEMAEDLGSVLNKLKQEATYPPLFNAAFGSPEITSQRMLKALAQFMATMVSANSKYDQVKRGEAQFSSREESGYALFREKCASCHEEPLFTDLSYRNTGLPVNPYLLDYGRMRITGRKEDSLKFRVPSLRNVALTFPYTHDGRLYRLDDVLDHYATGIRQSETLDPLLRNGIPLSNSEREAIKAFLNTLTDTSFVNDSRFGPPAN